jgi:hypothetical protein
MWQLRESPFVLATYPRIFATPDSSLAVVFSGAGSSLVARRLDPWTRLAAISDSLTEKAHYPQIVETDDGPIVVWAASTGSGWVVGASWTLIRSEADPTVLGESIGYFDAAPDGNGGVAVLNETRNPNNPSKIDLTFLTLMHGRGLRNLGTVPSPYAPSMAEFLEISGDTIVTIGVAPPSSPGQGPLPVLQAHRYALQCGAP